MSDSVGRLVELLRLERERPREFQNGGAAARAWLDRVRALKAELRETNPDMCAQLRGSQ